MNRPEVILCGGREVQIQELTDTRGARNKEMLVGLIKERDRQTDCHTVTDLWTSVVCREDRRIYVSCACGRVLCVEKTDVMYLVPVDKCAETTGVMYLACGQVCREDRRYVSCACGQVCREDRRYVSCACRQVCREDRRYVSRACGQVLCVEKTGEIILCLWTSV